LNIINRQDALITAINNDINYAKEACEKEEFAKFSQLDFFTTQFSDTK
jgi:hypothetical protein